MIPSVHPLVVTSKKSGSSKLNFQTALLFPPGSNARESLPESIPPELRRSIPSGWIVADHEALKFVRSSDETICPNCTAGVPCDFGRSRISELRDYGYTVDNGMELANALETGAAMLRTVSPELADDIGMFAMGARIGTIGLRVLGMLGGRKPTQRTNRFRQQRHSQAEKPEMSPEQEAAQVLKVAWPCTRADVKIAFAQRLHTTHPDKKKGSSANKDTADVVNARNVLFEYFNRRGE